MTKPSSPPIHRGKQSNRYELTVKSPNGYGFTYTFENPADFQEACRELADTPRPDLMIRNTTIFEARKIAQQN